MELLSSFVFLEMHKERGSGLVPWPQRLRVAPPRLEEIGISPEEFLEDTVSCRTNYCCEIVIY